MNNASKIIIDEILEESHIEKVSDVIFWALERYVLSNNSNGSVVAYAIIERIKESEKDNILDLLNYDKIDKLG